jgi:hypothetical protein
MTCFRGHPLNTQRKRRLAGTIENGPLVRHCPIAQSQCLALTHTTCKRCIGFGQNLGNHAECMQQRNLLV